MNTSNQITVIGNIGEAPTLKTKTKTGKSVVGFAIAQSASSHDYNYLILINFRCVCPAGI